MCTFIDIASGKCGFAAIDHNYSLYSLRITHIIYNHTHCLPSPPRRVVLQPPLAIRTHLCVINANVCLQFVSVCMCVHGYHGRAREFSAADDYLSFNNPFVSSTFIPNIYIGLCAFMYYGIGNTIVEKAYCSCFCVCFGWAW